MKTTFKLIIVLLLCKVSTAQIDSLKTISLDVEVVVLDQEKTKKELNSFFEAEKIVPGLWKENNFQFYANFILEEAAFNRFNKIMEDWGAFKSRKIESVNYTAKLATVNRDINRLNQEKEEYEKLLEQVGVQSEHYFNYWEKLDQTKTALKKKIELKERYEISNKKFTVKLKVIEENMLSDEPDFSFVNMPGIQYSYFIPANLESQIFPESMNGFSIKYLLNRRKTYLELGLFKSNGGSDSLKYDELYKFGVGQDFYSSHLGRGTRKFLNLYSGLNAGVFILTNDQNTLISWYATPSIGLELYKSKNLLFDTKVGYFLPFEENRNMRGFLFETSLNVVF